MRKWVKNYPGRIIQNSIRKSFIAPLERNLNAVAISPVTGQGFQNTKELAVQYFQ